VEDLGGPLSREHVLVGWCEPSVSFGLFPPRVGDGEDAADGVRGSGACVGEL
jgi:hypothetical protein